MTWNEFKNVVEHRLEGMQPKVWSAPLELLEVHLPTRPDDIVVALVEGKLHITKR